MLRGPAAALHGSGSPGGIVAITTKRPQFDPSGEVQFQAGNYGRTFCYRGAPATVLGSLGYRR